MADSRGAQIWCDQKGFLVNHTTGEMWYGKSDKEGVYRKPDNEDLGKMLWQSHISHRQVGRPVLLQELEIKVGDLEVLETAGLCHDGRTLTSIVIIPYVPEFRHG